ncbi:MAG: XRE family transcriptional regulator [Cytophagales bacterium]|nr:MAG: XRE family transcriptional regulator [Cytophagales bacterium]
MDNVSENIKKIRIEKSLTQVEMADRLGIKQSSYQQIESGRNDITFSRLQQIADVFQMSVIDIIEYGDLPDFDLEKLRMKDKIVEIRERVKELEGRVKELESWLKDKDLIIKYMAYELDTARKSIAKLIIENAIHTKMEIPQDLKETIELFQKDIDINDYLKEIKDIENTANE